MEYRQLGNTELSLSSIAYGAFAIGGTMWGGNDKKDSIAAVHASLDHGVTTLDTAPFYGFGLSEEMIGEALADRDRSRVQLLTKFGLVWDGDGRGAYFFDAEKDGKPVPVYRLASADSLVRELENSLRRLRTDYIDLLQLHWPDATTPIEETMTALGRLLRDGKIRAAGVSNYSVGQLDEAQKSIPVASNQVSYSMLNRAIESELIPYALAHQTGIIAYSPMERGLLTGSYFRNARLKSDDHRNGYFGQFDLTFVKSLLDALQPIADGKGITLAQLVLRWTTQQPGITSVLAGARNAAQAEANAGALHIRLSEAELSAIQTLLQGEKMER